MSSNVAVEVEFETPIKGNLRTTPFAHVLLDLLDERRCGTLVIHDDAGEIEARIRFESGVATGAHSAASEAGLSQMLIPLCARTHGGFMFLDGKNELGYGPSVVCGYADPLAVIAAAMRGPTREDAIDSVLSQLGEHALQVNPRAELERYGLSAQELGLVHLLARCPMNISQLQAELDLPARIVRRLVYQLSISGAVMAMPKRRASDTIVQVPRLPGPPPLPRFSEPPTTEFSASPRAKASATLLEQRSLSGVVARAVDGKNQRILSQSALGASGRYHVREPEHGWTEVQGVGTATSGFPEELPDALVQWRKEIVDRHRAVERQTYFEMLGVPTTASDDAIDHAFLTLSDRLRPEQLPDALAQVRETAEALLHYLIEAHETLLDPKRRIEYLRKLHAGAGTPATPPREQRAALAEAHRKNAELLLKRNDYAGALQEATRAFQLHPTAAHEAFYGWLIYLRHSTGGRVHPVARRHLKRALQRDSKCEQAHFYTACMLKQLGQEDEAHEHFSRTLRLNSDNMDAQREVRLYQSRHKRERPSVVDRLFPARGKRQAG